MQQIEALREVKRAEDEVKRLKEEAQREAQRILREAREEASRTLANASTEADAAYAAGVDAAKKATNQERTKIIAEGDKRADAVRKAASGPQFQKAVDVLMKRFSDGING
ncbi:MAG TPA: hypothetical protein VNZ52_13435 [Candidatus Thermoplasmatota archaeon]|nr:hypothetical protein [Candidatus Thermoplasmatota archaeon]